MSRQNRGKGYGQHTLPRQQHQGVSPGDYPHSTVPRVAPAHGGKQRPALFSLLNISGNDEVRRSIEALDRVLDEFSDESGISQGSDESLRRRTSATPQAPDSNRTEQARIIASQIAGGKALLKKTNFSKHLEDDDLPPPPPELLQPNARPSVLEVTLPNSPTHPGSPTNKEIYARHKRPPAIPKRSPETKLSNAEILQLREIGDFDSPLPPPDYDEEDNAPESGYITPEQQGSEVEYPVLGRAGPLRRQSSSSSSGHYVGAQNVIQAEVHSDFQGCVPDYPESKQDSIHARQGSVASLGSIPSFPAPLPPDGSMALQINPLHRSSSKPVSMLSTATVESSGSSSATLQDPMQPDDIYEHFIPPAGGGAGSLYGATLLPAESRDLYGGYGGDIYERTLPTPHSYNQNVPNSDGVQNRPLPLPPGGNMGNYPGRNSMPEFKQQPSVHQESFPPPPPQFADHHITNTMSPTSPVHPSYHFQRTLPHPQDPERRSSYPDSAASNSLPFPVKLRSTGSPLIKQSNESDHSGGSDSGIGSSVSSVPPSPQLTTTPKSSRGGLPPPTKPRQSHNISMNTPVPPPPPPPLLQQGFMPPPISSPSFPPPPPLHTQFSANDYAEVLEDFPPPPSLSPSGGMTEELATRVHAWTLTNQERPSQLRSQPDPHTALINQIQSGIKLRRSPMSRALFDQQAREEPSLSVSPHDYQPDHNYTYLDSIETCSTISSSSSGCHSNSSHSNSTASSPPPQTLPKPGSSQRNTERDFSTMPGNPSTTRGINSQKRPPIIDVTSLPGYQPVPRDCPPWKTALIEKKNRELEENARRQYMEQFEEQQRWKDVPEWKRSLIMEKEKRKQDETNWDTNASQKGNRGDIAPLEAERRKRDEEMLRLQSLPDWKRDLILKRRGESN